MLGHDAASAGDALLGRARDGTTVPAATAALFKSVVGTGIFALPPAIRACGIVFGTLMSVLMGLVSLYTTWAMVESVRKTCYILFLRKKTISSSNLINYTHLKLF